MSRIAVVGFGALGRQLLDLIEPQGARVVIFDDDRFAEAAPDAFPFAAYLDPRFDDCDFYVGLGYRHLVRKYQIVAALKAADRRMPPFVHPRAVLHPTSRVQDGCVVYPMCNVGAHVELGRGVLLNNSVVVSHDSHIGDAAYLSPGVVVSGRVMIGEAAFLGTGVLVANGCHIGARARVGIGSVVTQDVPDDGSAIGNPLRLLERPLELR